MKQTQVKLTKRAVKDLKSVPDYIQTNLLHWVELVETDGLQEVRKISGYHDEPLSGDRKGQRSIRLSKGYRAFYTTTIDGKIQIVEVIEVNKHKY